MDVAMRGVHFAVENRGEQCFPDGEEPAPFWETFAASGYEPGLLDLIDRLCKPRKVFIDIGAWVGAFSLYAAAKGADVVAFDPDPKAFDQLEGNVDLNLDLNVLPIRRAIVAEPGIARISAAEWGRGLTRAGPITEQSGFFDRADSLPRWLSCELIEPEEIALVKIDIEGGEIDLLPTLAPWLAEKKIPVRVSLHGEWAEKSWFNGYKTLAWPSTPFGDIVALPFYSLDRKGLA